RGNASGSRRTDELRRLRQLVGGSGVSRIGGKLPQSLAYRSRLRFADRPEVGTREVRGHHRKAIRLDLLQRVRELIDRIVGARSRTVPARIGGDDVEGRVRLLRTLHQIDERLAARLVQDAAAGVR